jgi:hypothetical protein
VCGEVSHRGASTGGWKWQGGGAREIGRVARADPAVIDARGRVVVGRADEPSRLASAGEHCACARPCVAAQPLSVPCRVALPGRLQQASETNFLIMKHCKRQETK